MAAQPSFLRYLAGAFNARPFGMVVAPNWIGVAAFGLLGLTNPGFWVLGAGLELGYLLALATNERFQRTVTAAAAPVTAQTDDWTARIGRALLTLGDQDRRRYQSVADRCRSIIETQSRQSATGLIGLEAQRDGLTRLTWMYLRLLLARQAAERIQADPATRELPTQLAKVELRLSSGTSDDGVRRSLEEQADILRQRIAHRAEAGKQLDYIDAELGRIEQQVELLREQAALATDPSALSSRINEITAALGGTSQWIRDQQQVLGAVEDLLIEPSAGVPGRAKELQ